LSFCSASRFIRNLCVTLSKRLRDLGRAQIVDPKIRDDGTTQGRTPGRLEPFLMAGRVVAAREQSRALLRELGATNATSRSLSRAITSEVSAKRLHDRSRPEPLFPHPHHRLGFQIVYQREIVLPFRPHKNMASV
jgi:hypothetical protein